MRKNIDKFIIFTKYFQLIDKTIHHMQKKMYRNPININCLGFNRDAMMNNSNIFGLMVYKQAYCLACITFLINSDRFYLPCE